MSSKRELTSTFESCTLIAVLMALVRYIMQSIGPRGMKALVCLLQLGVTVVMSILRGTLRMQRLGWHDNIGGDMPDVARVTSSTGSPPNWRSPDPNQAYYGTSPPASMEKLKQSHQSQGSQRPPPKRMICLQVMPLPCKLEKLPL